MDQVGHLVEKLKVHICRLESVSMASLGLSIIPGTQEVAGRGE